MEDGGPREREEEGEARPSRRLLARAGRSLGGRQAGNKQTNTLEYWQANEQVPPVEHAADGHVEEDAGEDDAGAAPPAVGVHQVLRQRSEHEGAHARAAHRDARREAPAPGGSEGFVVISVCAFV